MNTPVLFLIFNRLDTTQKVFDEIRKQKPKYLYVAADGPRPHKIGEKELCDQTRSIVNQIDWNCELKTLFREKNLGCGKAVSSAITWFFENVEQGIILEDDCLPHPDFFPYCEELLERYRVKNEVKIISGNDFYNENKKNNSSYFFSKYPFIWGWAAWRRTWNEYDFYIEKINVKQFSEILKQSQLPVNSRLFWIDKFLTMKSQWFEKKLFIPLQKLNTWDYQLTFSIIREQGFCIVPCVNLISNIGFGTDSTHTKSSDNPDACLPIFDIMPLKHSEKIEINEEADKYFNKTKHWKPLWKALLRCSYSYLYFTCAKVLNKK